MKLKEKYHELYRIFISPFIFIFISWPIMASIQAEIKERERQLTGKKTVDFSSLKTLAGACIITSLITYLLMLVGVIPP